MKKFWAVWLAFLIFTGSLIPKCDFNQFAKVPALIKHYYKHLSANNTSEGLSFIHFLAMHYNADAKHHEDDHQDLPLLNHVVNAIFFIIIPDLQLQTPVKCKEETNFTAYRIIYIFNSIFSLLQPPQ